MRNDCRMSLSPISKISRQQETNVCVGMQRNDRFHGSIRHARISKTLEHRPDQRHRFFLFLFSKVSQQNYNHTPLHLSGISHVKIVLCRQLVPSRSTGVFKHRRRSAMKRTWENFGRNGKIHSHMKSIPGPFL